MVDGWINSKLHETVKCSDSNNLKARLPNGRTFEG